MKDCIKSIAKSIEEYLYKLTGQNFKFASEVFKDKPGTYSEIGLKEEPRE